MDYTLDQLMQMVISHNPLVARDINIYITDLKERILKLEEFIGFDKLCAFDKTDLGPRTKED